MAEFQEQPNAFNYGLSIKGRTAVYNQKSFNDLIVQKYKKDFWSRTGNAFQYVSLSKDNEFVVNSMSANPMVFQAGASGCSSTPTRGLSFGSDSMSGNRAHISIAFCETDLLNTCFQADYEWQANGKLELKDSVKNELTRLILSSITEGLFLALISGNTYGADQLKTEDGGTLEENRLFIQTTDAHTGIVPTLKNNVAEYQHWNVPGAYNANSQDGKRFTGSAVEVFDKLHRYAEDKGIAIGDAITEEPENLACVVDVHTYRRLRKEHAEQCEQVGIMSTKCKDAITIEKRGGKSVFLIHDVIVVPVSEITFYDKFVGRTSRFMAIERKGNFVLGGSIKGRGSNLSGLRLRKQDTSGGANQYIMVADFLLLSHIANANDVVATQEQFVQKK